MRKMMGVVMTLMGVVEKEGVVGKKEEEQPEWFGGVRQIGQQFEIEMRGGYGKGSQMMNGGLHSGLVVWLLGLESELERWLK